MTEGKRNIIQGLLQEYNIETAADIQEGLKDLLGETIKEMMEAEMDYLHHQRHRESEFQPAAEQPAQLIPQRYRTAENALPLDFRGHQEVDDAGP